jgi:hypothetical protein
MLVAQSFINVFCGKFCDNLREGQLKRKLSVSVLNLLEFTGLNRIIPQDLFDPINR